MIAFDDHAFRDVRTYQDQAVADSYNSFVALETSRSLFWIVVVPHLYFGDPTRYDRDVVIVLFEVTHPLACFGQVSGNVPANGMGYVNDLVFFKHALGVT